MAIRIDASGDYLKRTTSLPNTNSGKFTQAGWVYIHSVRSSVYQYFMGTENADASATAYLVLGYNDSGLFVLSKNGAADISFASNPPTGEWVFFVVQFDGTGSLGTAETYGKFRTMTGNWVTVSHTAVNQFTTARLDYGNDSWDEWCDVSLGPVKIWDELLTEAELENEMFSIIPKRTENLHLWSPTLDGSSERNKDYSGNGRDWTEGGTLTETSPPPISWGALYDFVIDNPVGGAIQLVVQDSAHAHAADSPTLTVQGVLEVQDAAHANVADNVVLTQHHVLVVADAAHAHAADNVVLGYYQKLIPDGDISDGNWLNQAGSNTNLYQSLDETPTYSETDWARVEPSGTPNAFQVSLSNAEDPGVSTGHVVRYRYGKAGTAIMNLTVRLKQGTTTIASWVHGSIGANTTAEQTLTAGEANSITDYTDLRLEFEAEIGSDALLEVSATNPRYLVDQNGKPVYLAGFHTWYNIQDGGPTDPPTTFDWTEYITAIQSYGCNFTKLWASMETAEIWSNPTTVANPQYFSPPRYERTGPGNAADGKLKFDLTQINQDYLDRLVARASALNSAGVYFVVQIFQGWQIDTKGATDNPWTAHPYRAENNINSLDGDFDNDGEGTETHTDTNNAAWSYQQAIVEAIIDATKDFPYLVGWEVSNEDTSSTANTNWQEDLISHINTYQTGNALQHLVMRTVCWPSGSNADLDASAAQLVSYNADTESLYDGTKVAMRDTDHIEGITSDYANLWYAMLIGAGGSWYMDEWDGLVYATASRINDATYILIRENLGYMAELTAMLNDMEGMTPQGGLSSAGYCLAKNHATAGEYIVYYDGSSTFTLNLTTATGTLNIRWLRCSDGTVQDTATVSGGANRTLTPPWTGRVVAYVRHI